MIVKLSSYTNAFVIIAVSGWASRDKYKLTDAPMLLWFCVSYNMNGVNVVVCIGTRLVSTIFVW